MDESGISNTNALVKLFESVKDRNAGRVDDDVSRHCARDSTLSAANLKPVNLGLSATKGPKITKPSEPLAATDRVKDATLRHPEDTLSVLRPGESDVLSSKVDRSKIQVSDKFGPTGRSRDVALAVPPPRKLPKITDLDTSYNNEASSSVNHSNPKISNTPARHNPGVPQSVDNTRTTSDMAKPDVGRTSPSYRQPNVDKKSSPSVSRERRSLERDNFLSVGRIPLRESTLIPYTITPQLTADSLANAMVASSLASSRAPSPSKPAPPPLHRQTKPQSLFRRSQSLDQVEPRTSSPGKTMRLTMRGPPKSDDEEDRRKMGSHLLKHPNKHHEGDRKRWRDQITERERKRYEGVWAANKGLFMPAQSPKSALCVLNLVVRDIWRRSRLPDDVLEEVWDLVDNEVAGRLSKDEFVVGMWLIDQRLKGRKLPVRVSNSVWFSARRLSGIKVPKTHR